MESFTDDVQSVDIQNIYSIKTNIRSNCVCAVAVNSLIHIDSLNLCIEPVFKN